MGPEHLHIVAVFPPPTTGMTLVTERMSAVFSVHTPTYLYPVTKPEGTSGIRWTLYKHFEVARNLRRALKAGATTCYYVPDSDNGLYFNLILHAPLLARFERVILHHHVYSYLTKHTATFAKFLKRLQSKGGQALHVVLAQDMAEKLRVLYKVQHVHVLGNTSFVSTPRPTQLSKTTRSIGFLSNITEAKGIRVFLETARTVPDVDIDIAGPISDPELQQDIEDFVQQDPARRRWWGPVYGDEKAAFFAKIDALLFPSSYVNEAQPLTIFEMLALHKPVLATPQGAILDQLSGTSWVIDHERFVRDASRTLRTWSTQPDVYQEACAQAAQVWDKRRAADSDALAHLVQVVKDGAQFRETVS
mgnify:CR=1 FL=1